MYQRIDRLDRVAFARGNLRGVDERRAVQTNIDEGGLHAGQHPYHLAFVDIADDATALRALDMHLLQHTVFHHRHPRFHGVMFIRISSLIVVLGGGLMGSSGCGSWAILTGLRAEAARL